MHTRTHAHARMHVHIHKYIYTCIYIYENNGNGLTAHVNYLNCSPFLLSKIKIGYTQNS